MQLSQISDINAYNLQHLEHRAQDSFLKNTSKKNLKLSGKKKSRTKWANNETAISPKKQPPRVTQTTPHYQPTTLL